MVRKNSVVAETEVDRPCVGMGGRGNGEPGKIEIGQSGKIGGVLEEAVEDGGTRGYGWIGGDCEVRCFFDDVPFWFRIYEF